MQNKKAYRGIICKPLIFKLPLLDPESLRTRDDPLINAAHAAL